MTTTYDWQTRLAPWRAQGASTLVTPPVGDPVSVESFKRHSRIPSNDDTLLPMRITAARQWVERYTGRALLNQTWRLSLDAPPECSQPILLPVVPLVSVTSITSYDYLHAATVLVSTNYYVDTARAPARVYLNSGSAWPTNLRSWGGLVIDYVAGYGAAPDDVPAPLLQAIYLLAAEWNERLEAASDLKLEEIPLGVKALCDPYMVIL